MALSRALTLSLLSVSICMPLRLRARAPFDTAGYLTPGAYDGMLREREGGGLVQPPAAAERALRRAAVAASLAAAAEAAYVGGVSAGAAGNERMDAAAVKAVVARESLAGARFASRGEAPPPAVADAAGAAGAAVAAVTAPAGALPASKAAVAAGSFLLGRLKSDAGATKAPLGRTMTDFEMCQGCQVTLARVLEHSTAATPREEMRFALHSACHNQPPVLDEACDWLLQQDAFLADLLRQPGARGPRWGEPCHAVGLCTLSDLANTRALPAAAKAPARVRV